MKVRILDSFIEKLTAQADYIAKDKPYAAQKFESEVMDLMNKLESQPPHQNRVSIYFNDDNIRDLIFKGYKIIYRIIPEENTIEAFEVINYQ